MSQGVAPVSHTRRLVEIAVSGYGVSADEAAFDRGIDAQVAVVRRWWADESLPQEYRFGLVAPKELRSVRDLRRFLDDQELEDADDDDTLVVYVTGHGLSRGSGEHFLRLPDSDADRVIGTAFSTAELVARVLDSRAEHVLVMVDSCFSGVLREDLLRRLKALGESRRRLNSLVVISSANEEESPRLEQFSQLLEGVAAHCRDDASGFAGPYLSFQEFFASMAALHEEAVTANVQKLWPPDSVLRDQEHLQPSPCLPNPGYRPLPVLVGEARSAVAWNPGDFDTYWLSRATGQPSAGMSGWYFTGRAAQVRRMVEFLEGEGTALVVTGEVGSGKSALLARVVTLSDPRFRADEQYRPFIEAIPPDLVVPCGAVDAAVLARNTDADELTATLYTALTGEPPTSGEISPLDQLLDHALATVRREMRPVTIVVDGIDEARNPTRTITDLLRPLADLWADGGQPAVRMLLGIRSARTAAPGRLRPAQDRAPDLLSLLVRSTNADEPLRTDVGTMADITAYVSTLLRVLFDRSSSLPRPETHRLDEAAAAVAAEVAPSFLDARLAAEALHARGQLPDANDLEWRSTLRQGTRELLRWDIQEVQRNSGLDAGHAVQVLQATAFAQGAGLPWAEVWPCAVQALAGGEITAPDALIRQVRDTRLAGYLTTGVESGRFVYRPIHESVTEVLRQPPHALVDAEARPERLEVSAQDTTREAHQKLAMAFSALHATQDGPPHPYLGRHLIQHAAAGGVLNDRVITEKFLPHETSGNVRGLLGLLSDHTADTAGLLAWTRIEPFMADAPARARAESLRFARYESEADAPVSARRTESLADGYVLPKWKDLAVPGNVLAKGDTDVCSLASFTLRDGTPLIAVGGEDGTVQVWDPSTADLVGQPISGYGPRARALAVVQEPDGEPLLAVGCDGGVWTCDPLSGESTRLPVTVPAHDMVSFTGSDGVMRLAIGVPYGLVLCDPHRGTLDGDRDQGGAAANPVDTLAALTLPGGRTLLAVHRGDQVVVLDGASLDPVCAVPLVREHFSTLALLAEPQDGAVLAVATRAPGAVRFWDVLTGTERRHATIMQSAAVLAPYRHPRSGMLLALGGHDGSLHLWDLGTGEETSRFPTDHTGTVTGLAVVPGHHGFPVLVSGSLDRTVRVWNPDAWARRAARSSSTADGTLLAVLPGSAGQAELITVGPDRNLLVRSADTGSAVRSIDLPYTGVDGPVTALVVHAAPDGSAVVVGLPDGTVGCWSGTWRLMDAWTSQGDHATALTVFAQGARTVLAVGTSSGAVVYCDLATGEVLGWLHVRRDTGGPVHALAYLPAASGGVLVVASDRGLALCHPFQERYEPWPGVTGAVVSLAVCPGAEEDEWYLIAGGADGRVLRWVPHDPEREPFSFATRHDGPVSALGVVLPIGARPLIASTGRSDTTVRLWEFGTGQEVLRLVTATSLTSLCVLPFPSVAATPQPVLAFGGPAGIAAATLRLPQCGEQPAGGSRSR